MRLEIYAVQDAVVGAFAQPIFMVNRGAALRSVQSALGDPSQPFTKHPADFSLWMLGHYDDNSGLITPMVPPERVIGFAEFGPAGA